MSKDNNFEEAKCPYVGGSNDGEHYYKRVEEWDGKRWISQEQCTKCEHVVDSHIDGCECSFDKKHRPIFSSIIEPDGVKFILKTCLACNEQHKYKSVIKGIKWRHEKKNS